jgi:predicted DNA-binding transcriptional regulator AlpA
MARQIALPPSLAPVLIGREKAAALIDLSPNEFDRLVKAGAMPPPRRLTQKRQAWLVHEIISAAAPLPVVHRLADAEDGWGDVDAS